MNTNEVHVHPLSATDPLGYLPCRVAHSRKVMKGEDKSFASPGVQWRGVSFDAFGLFDGHGGKDAAEHCADRFVPALIEALDAAGPSPPETDPEDVFEDRVANALVAAFATVDQEFLGKDIHSGATATIVCVNGRRVTSAAVGDSLATLDCGHGVSAVRLTPEHRLDTSAAERKRIEDAGGEVRATAFEEGKPVGPLRVWPGGLAVSRSIGDRDGKRGGVSSEPEVSSLIVPDSQPGFRLVLASDGLWDAVTVKQAAQCGGKLGTGPCAAALCKLAQKQKDNRDDITVLVADYLAGGTDKSPLTARPPWRTELEVQWPLGRRRYDPAPCASARRSTRMEGEAEAERVERVEREAIEAARARARDVDELSKANARRLAELEEYTRSKASGTDDGGWEEVGGKGGGHGVKGAVEAQEPKALSAKHNKKEKKDAGKKNKATTRPDHAVTKKVPTNGGRGNDREGQRGGRGGRGARDDVAVAMDGLNIDPTAEERSSPKPPPRPRAQPAAAPVALAAVNDVTSAPAAPTPEATDSPIDTRSPIKKKSRKRKKERAAERAAMEADAAAAAEKLPPRDEPPAPPPPPPQAQQSQVDHRALIELQYRAMAEMHAQHQYMMQQRDRLAHGNGHDSPPPPPIGPPRMAHPGFVGHHSPPPPPMAAPPHFIPPHVAQHVPGVHHGAPGPAPPVPPGSPGPPTPATVPGTENLNSSPDVKPKQKRKGKRERAMERARLAAAEAAAAGGSGASSPVPPGGPPPHAAAMMMGHQRGPPPGIPPGMAPMAGWHPGMIHPPQHLSMPPGPWQGH